ncbi:MAG: iron-sulfur cluster assembly scaffold protein [Planctomycetes bacterium]|nr:iron-sulfur cluster assembly scaffold protein [Planctomycetota bacterium]
MVSPGLRALLASAEGAGVLAGEGVEQGSAVHPVCGDELSLSFRMDGDCFAEVQWQAVGCPACMAVAAALPSAWRGAPRAAAAHFLHARLEALGGLAPHERHAEALALDALRAARPRRR